MIESSELPMINVSFGSGMFTPFIPTAMRGHVGYKISVSCSTVMVACGEPPQMPSVPEASRLKRSQVR